MQNHYPISRTLMCSHKKTSKVHAKFGMRRRQYRFYSLQREFEIMQANIHIHADGYRGKCKWCKKKNAAHRLCKAESRFPQQYNHCIIVLQSYKAHEKKKTATNLKKKKDVWQCGDKSCEPNSSQESTFTLLFFFCE